ncbi:MAG: S8 family serine peptidase, partial [Candidatus Eisenbacteria bacterium]|nr:S8 family serine peptidase [Candidatus Eisenbacteria bacterium]
TLFRSYPEVIAVGATNPADEVATFSNWGDELDVVAPGVDIYSTFPGNTYFKASGTSTAAPFVSGLAALVVSENDEITQHEMEDYLRAHSKPLTGASAERDGYGRVDFTPLTDVSDAPPPYGVATHTNFAWEWLGEDASPETSIADPFDGDYRPNIGAPHAADGYDDGVFRGSLYTLPILPPHLLGGGESFDIGLTVADPMSPRYGSEDSKKLHLDVWADWDGDGTFEGAASEHVVADATFDPTTWGGNHSQEILPFTPVDEHIYGNPVVVRTRLAYGASAGSPDGTVPFGEVEDDTFINFVEEFDVDSRVHVPGVYMTMGNWDLAPDPTPWCGNRGDGWLSATAHPDVGDPCNGFIEAVSVMASPDMDWTEYSAAFIRVWYCHQLFDDMCSEEGDNCRIRIDRNGVKIDLGPIPIGSGTLFFDVSDLVGTDVVRVEFVEDTDLPGHVAIDDLVVWAFDGEDPVAITDLSVSRVAGDRELELDWSAPDENLFIPAPPADGQANVYDIRYSQDPIATDADWMRSRPVRPSELTAAGPTPSAPGGLDGLAFLAPSAFVGYATGVRTMDETTNRSAISNAASVGNTPTLGVVVIGQGEVEGSPGETVTVDFRIGNTGNIADDYAITAMDTEGYELLDLPDLVRLAPGASALYGAQVKIATNANDGDVDSLTVIATSLASAGTVGMGTETILVSGGTSDVSPGPDGTGGPGGGADAVAADAYALRLSGANPFRDRLDLLLELPKETMSSVVVYASDGRKVREVVHETLAAGQHALVWDGKDERGYAVASGTYFLLVRTAEWGERRRVVMVR